MSVLLAALVLGQVPTGKPPRVKHKLVVMGEQSVTAIEAREAFTRLGALFKRTSALPMGTTAIPAANRPATRAEIVAEMARLAKASEPAFRFVPAPVPHDARLFNVAAAQRSTLDRLVTWGCVARIGPLAVGPGTSLTPSQFGDALGFFAARIAQMSHLPSPKWTPMLQKE